MAAKLKNRSEIEEKYKWNLEDMVPSAEKFEELFGNLKSQIPEYENFKGTLGSSPARLFEYLDFEEKLDQVFSLLSAYATQKSDEDTSVGENQALVSRVHTLASAAMEMSAFAEPEILAVPDERMDSFLNDPVLSHYKKQLERLLAKKEHMLSGPEERILAAAAQTAQAPASIYRLFNNADLTFGSIEDEDGETVELTHGRFIKFLESKNRRVREDAFHTFYKSYRQFANTVAAAFEGNIKQACFYAGMRKYPSTRAYYLAGNEVPENVYDNLLKTVNENLPLLHRYVSLRKKCLGVSKLHMYDLYVPLSSSYEKTVPYEEAKTMIKTALKPLGEEYGKLLDMGFNGRWIDVYENKGKRSGGYSNCVYGVHPYVLLSYDDNLDSALTLAHEMGHSLHSWYSNENQPYTYAGYKIFVAEVASTCNEVLFLNYMIGHAESKEEKFYLINQFLERFRSTMFRQTMFAEFEWDVHQMGWEGTPLTKDTLYKLYHELNEKYFGSDMVVDEDIDCEWERIPHFYRPFYVYQYATGFAAATAIAGRILSGDKEALDGYFKFLKGGASMTPVELLKLCGLDMEQPQVVKEALCVFEQLLNELEALS